MKKIVMMAILMMVIFIACNNDDDFSPNYVSVGTIEEVDSQNIDFVVNLDGGTVLTPVSYTDDNIVADGDRVLVNYVIIEEKSDDDFNVNIFDIDDILTKGFIQLTEQNKDSIGNDPIYTSGDNIWISDKHLNVFFEYYGYHETHLINLVKPIGEPVFDDDGRLVLEFRHNAKDDYPYSLLSGLVCFELESLRLADEESIDFVVRFKGYEEDYEFTGTYEFESSTAASQKIYNNKLLKLSGSKFE